jgi:type III restriction enzyme
MYTRSFQGKIYLPHFCVLDGSGYEALDYYCHLMGHVDVMEFAYGAINWPLAEAMKEAKDRFYRITLGQDISREYETEADWWETDEQVLAWLVASLPFDYLSHKQLGAVVRRVYQRLCKAELSGMVRDRLALVKFVVRDHVERFIQEQLDLQTEQAFAELHNRGKLLFYLECAECRFEIPNSIQIKSTRPLTRDDGSPVAKSLFEYVEYESANQYERAIAVCIDEHPEVLWWYRNLVGKHQFSIQGYRRNRIWPDFVVQSETHHVPVHQVLVIESKGEHLEGNPNTRYKRRVADYFERVGKKVSWQQLGEDFKDHMFRFQILDQAQDRGRDWKDELRRLLAI